MFFAYGCGGGGISGSSTPAVSSDNSTGLFCCKINWPEKDSSSGSRYISSSTSTINITITGDGITGSMTKSVAYGSSEILVYSVPVGNKQATLSAVNSSGTVLSHRIVNYIQAGGQITSVQANMGVTVKDNEVIPSSMTIPVSTSLTFKNNGSKSYSIKITPPNAGTVTTNYIVTNASFTYAFNTAGTYTGYVVEEPALTFTITVTDDPQPYSGPLAINALVPSSGSVGTTVNIIGSGFGSVQGTSTVTFNGTAVTPISWSPYQIVCLVPSGASTGNVVVTVSGTASNAEAFTVTGGWTPTVQ
ncbi:MAG: IPT/TIG domain-containing protein [Armatimonadota bacterium]